MSCIPAVGLTFPIRCSRYAITRSACLELHAEELVDFVQTLPRDAQKRGALLEVSIEALTLVQKDLRMWDTFERISRFYGVRAGQLDSGQEYI